MRTDMWTGKSLPALFLGAVCLLFSGLSLAATDESEADKTNVAANDQRMVLAPEPVYASNLPPPAIPVDYVVLGIIGGAAILAGSADGGGDTTTTTTTTP